MQVDLVNVRPDSVLGGVFPDPDVRVEFTLMTKEQFATIYFSLRAYADKLEQQLDTVKDLVPSKTNVAILEERMFLHKSLANVYETLFEMIENHPDGKLANMRAWSEVV
jgi:hypothetical protein